jgi:transcriptional regulator GlxA family with amidase domain
MKIIFGMAALLTRFERMPIRLFSERPADNDENRAVTAMASRTVAIVLHPGFQLLDVAGPTAAFEMAGRFRPGSYDVRLLAPGGGAVDSSCGATLAAQPLAELTFDTVMISGGEIVRSMPALQEILAWLRRVNARRITSVCSGAFILAEAGLLDGRRATTHWASSRDFCSRYPRVDLHADRIYVRDGDVWTSAGISSGIDLALALIEDDLGPEAARYTAQQLVVYHRRPGGQSQFSALVDLGGRTGRFAEMILWMRERLAERLTVERLADKAAMSPRNFARVFNEEVGMTPAKAVERLRLETARAAVETSHDSLEKIAAATGFRDAGNMRRAFLRGFGQPPLALRRARARFDRAPPQAG